AGAPSASKSYPALQSRITRAGGLRGSPKLTCWQIKQVMLVERRVIHARGREAPPPVRERSIHQAADHSRPQEFLHYPAALLPATPSERSRYERRVPVVFSVDYPERPLNRLTSALRI